MSDLLQAVHGYRAKTISGHHRHVQAVVNIPVRAEVISIPVLITAARKEIATLRLREAAAAVRALVLIREAVAVRAVEVIVVEAVQAVAVQAVAVRDNTEMNHLYGGHVEGVSSLNYKGIRK